MVMKTARGMPTIKYRRFISILLFDRFDYYINGCKPEAS